MNIIEFTIDDGTDEDEEGLLFIFIFLGNEHSRNTSSSSSSGTLIMMFSIFSMSTGGIAALFGLESANKEKHND